MIKLFYGYDVYDDGKVFIHGSSKQISVRITSGGYLKVNLTINGKRRRVLIHRLVAHLFLGMDLNDQNIDVHHRNKIRSDNKCRNLELVSCASHIAQHAKDSALIKFPHDNSNLKECRKCRIVKYRSEFYVKKANSDGTSSWCRDCCKGH